jgi:hypothetical protein
MYLGVRLERVDKDDRFTADSISIALSRLQGALRGILMTK